MASLPFPPPGALDRPPPSPANPPPASAAPPPQDGFAGTGVPGTPPPGPTDALKQLATMGMEIDRALVAFAEMVPGEVPEIGQARKLLQAALAKILASGGEQMTSPGGTGTQFPGGGMAAGIPF